jgi:hypothetical protein
MTTDTAELVKRLRKRGHPLSTSGSSLFNPDGEAAADAIERLEAEKIEAYQRGQRNAYEKSTIIVSNWYAGDVVGDIFEAIRALPIEGEVK